MAIVVIYSDEVYLEAVATLVDVFPPGKAS